MTYSKHFGWTNWTIAERVSTGSINRGPEEPVPFQKPAAFLQGPWCAGCCRCLGIYHAACSLCGMALRDTYWSPGACPRNHSGSTFATLLDGKGNARAASRKRNKQKRCLSSLEVVWTFQKSLGKAPPGLLAFRSPTSFEIEYDERSEEIKPQLWQKNQSKHEGAVFWGYVSYRL